MASHSILTGGQHKRISMICRFALAIGMLVASLPASACIYPPQSLQRPDETSEQYQVRIKAETEQRRLTNIKAFQARLFAEAEQVYFARVVKSEEIKSSNNPYGRQTTLKPIEAIKGILPTESAVLKVGGMTSCGPDADGSASWGNVGDLALVFGGKLNGAKKPVTFGVLAKDVMDEALAAYVRNFQLANPYLYPLGAPK